MKHKKKRASVRDNTTLFRFLRGYVTFSILGGFEERFLSELFSGHIPVWHIRHGQDGILHAQCYARDYRNIAAAARKHHVRIRIVKRSGILLRMSGYRHRVGVVLGILLVIFLLSFMSNRAWNISVIGNAQTTIADITRVTEELGIKRGAFIPALDFNSIERQTLLKIRTLSWIGISRQGSHLVIEVRERVDAPYTVPENRPCNIVAAYAGTIEKLEVYAGQAMVAQKQAVEKGSLLVSGLVADETGTIHYEHSRAKVIAVYEIVRTFTVPERQSVLQPSGKTVTRNYLSVAGFDIPLSLGGSIHEESTYSEEISSVKFISFTTPFALKKGTYTLLEPKEVVYTAETARSKLEEDASRYAEEFLSGLELLGQKTEDIPSENGFGIRARYQIRGDIALKQEIWTKN